MKCRYPVKEWLIAGTFRARDERTIQSFSLLNELVYVKFLKIEMHSHYGREHYCPLSILRFEFCIIINNKSVHIVIFEFNFSFN